MIPRPVKAADYVAMRELIEQLGQEAVLGIVAYLFREAGDQMASLHGPSPRSQMLRAAAADLRRIHRHIDSV